MVNAGECRPTRESGKSRKSRHAYTNPLIKLDHRAFSCARSTKTSGRTQRQHAKRPFIAASRERKLASSELDTRKSLIGRHARATDRHRDRDKGRPRAAETLNCEL